MKIAKIGILTSGGDGPGMNAAIRAVARSALSAGLEVVGIMRGYQGLLDEEFVAVNHRFVSNIINRGGTILKTARSDEFRTYEGKRKAAMNAQKHHIDALVVIGGDGSYQGAADFYNKFNVPCVCLPGTIDNDLYGTDQTIGCHTAVDTAIEAIDKIRDTCHSMERIFVVEVMGNKSGYIALQVALASGSEAVIIPERKFDYEKMVKDLTAGHSQGKVSWIVVTAEGAAKAQDVAGVIKTMTGLDTRFAVLGHVQRGGNPNGADRLLSTRLGAHAVELLVKGEFGKAVGILQDEINVVELAQAKKREFPHIDRYLELMNALR